MKKKTLLLTVIIIIALLFLPGSAGQGKNADASDPNHTSAASTVSSSWIDLEGVQNTRTLAAYQAEDGRTIRPDTILRSGKLDRLTDSDTATLTSEYRLSTVIDLRDEVETADAPDPTITGTAYHHLDVWPRAVRLRMIEESTIDGRLDSDLYVKNYYMGFALEPTAIKTFRTMFEILLEHTRGAVLLHCTHGKDRTGAAVTLILSALGVSWSDIEQEYMLSDTALPGSVALSSIRHYRSVIEDHYGSMEHYLSTEMELDAAKLATLQKLYTIEQ